MTVNPGLPLNARYGTNTALTGDQEKQYQHWVSSKIAPMFPYGKEMAQDASASSPSDYDYRGYFLNPGEGNSVNPIDGELHFPDTYKKPNHRTFSQYSQYSASNPNKTGLWLGLNDLNMRYLPPINTYTQLQQAHNRFTDH